MDVSEDEEGRLKSNGDASGDEDDDEHLIALTEENIEEITELHDEATRPIEAVLRKQFSGEIPVFIQVSLCWLSTLYFYKCRV